MGKYSEAFEYVERSKTRNLVEQILDRDRDTIFPQEVVQQLKQLSNQIASEQRQIQEGKAGNYQELAGHLQKLRQQRNELQDNYLPVGSSFNLEQFQTTLDEKTAIIEWYITSEEILAFVITKNSQLDVWRSQPEEPQNLVDWAIEYLDTLDTYDENSKWQDSLVSQLSHLGRILHLEEIFLLIPETCSKLILIPHLVLHLFPLHALQSVRQTSNAKAVMSGTLMELFSDGVSYAPSCQILQQLQQRKRDKFTNLLALQTPTEDLYGMDLGTVNAIKRQFPNSRILKQNQAKKAALMQQTGKDNQHTIIFNQELIAANCLFFFCHGYYNENSPLDSGLQLADGYLTLGELLIDFDLENCRLVTLAACETGLVDPNNTSDEYIGLPSGFLLAGSTNVVSSLWKVDATATALLMTKFYQELQQEKRISVALIAAQKWLRDTTVEGFRNWLPNSSLSDDGQDEIDLYFDKIEQGQGVTTKCFESPYYWAAFCTIGKGV